MLIDELSTPAILIEKKRLDRNMTEMQSLADLENVHLRPHIKTHKSISIARVQVQMGASGITAAKPGEAAIFVRAGIKDVRIAYPIVGRDRLELIDRLQEHASVSFCIDTFEGGEQASKFFRAHGKRAEVLIEVDTGHGRTGLHWERPESLECAKRLYDLPGIKISGVLTHGGHSYHGPGEGETTEEALRRTSKQERDRIIFFAERLHAAGIESENFEVSIGSTPSISRFSNLKDGTTITEIRPGNYVFYDAMQVGLGVVPLDRCALTVVSTVVSKHRAPGGTERLFLDAGKKVLTSDTGFGTNGFGTMLYNASQMIPLPHARINDLSEEHAWVQISGGSTLKVGDRVRIVPNHACVTVNTQNRMFIVDEDEVLDELKVDARGLVN